MYFPRRVYGNMIYHIVPIGNVPRGWRISGVVLSLSICSMTYDGLVMKYIANASSQSALVAFLFYFEVYRYI